MKLIDQIKTELKELSYPWTLNYDRCCIVDANGDEVLFFQGAIRYPDLPFIVDAPTYIDRLLNIIEELSSNPQVISDTNTPPKPRFALGEDDKWYAYFGEDIKSSISGVGDSPAEAYEDFLSIWNQKVDMEY